MNRIKSLVVILVSCLYLSFLFLHSNAKLLYYENIKSVKFRERFDKNNTHSYILQFRAFNQSFKIYLFRARSNNPLTVEWGSTFSTTTNQIGVYGGVLVDRPNSSVIGVLPYPKIFYGRIDIDNESYHIEHPNRFQISTETQMIIFRQSDLKFDFGNRTFCKIIEANTNETHEISTQSMSPNNITNFFLSKRQTGIPEKYDYSIFILSPAVFEIIIRSYPSRNSLASIELTLLYIMKTVGMTNTIYKSNTNIGLKFAVILSSLHIVTDAECKSAKKSQYKYLCDENSAKQIEKYEPLKKLFTAIYPMFDSIVTMTYRPNAKLSIETVDEEPIGLANKPMYCEGNYPAFILLNPDQHGKDLDSLSIGYILAHEYGHTLSASHDDEFGDVCMENYVMKARFSTLSEMSMKFSSCSIKQIKSYVGKSKHKKQNCFVTKSAAPSIKCPNGTPCKSGDCKLLTCDFKHCREENVKDFSPCGNDKICFKGRCIDHFCKQTKGSDYFTECSEGCLLKCVKKLNKTCSYLLSGPKTISLPGGSSCDKGKGFCRDNGKCEDLEGKFTSLSSRITAPCLLVRFVYNLKEKYVTMMIILICTVSLSGIIVFVTFGNESNEETVNLFHEDIYRWSFKDTAEMFKTSKLKGKIWHRKTIMIDEENKNFCYTSAKKYLKRYPFLFQTRKFATAKYHPKSPEFTTKDYSQETERLSTYRRFSSVMLARESLRINGNDPDSLSS